MWSVKITLASVGSKYGPRDGSCEYGNESPDININRTFIE
jgi:hypothetical protein